jgi:uncharacterized protein HemY
VAAARDISGGSIDNLGVVAQEQGDLEAACEYFESSVATRRGLEDTQRLALSLAKLGEVIAARGDVAAAQRVLAESIVLQSTRPSRN